MATTPALDVGIVGATGLVGREFLALLERRRFPIRRLRLLASERSAGSRIEFGGEEITVEALAGADPAGLDLVLFSAGKEVARAEAPRFAAAGALVVDNSSAFREDPDVPLVVPEINAAELATRPVKGIVANPNCSTIMLILPVAALERAFGVEEIVVSTYQSVSGAGQAAVDELFGQARAFARGEAETWQHYDRPIFLNLIPKVGELGADGACLEEVKMVDETRRILGRADLAVYATTVRVPVERCHSESVLVRLRWPVTLEDVTAALEGAPGVELHELPTPRELARREATYVGRIRVGEADRRVVRFWVVGDQLWKGAALNTIQIAETLIVQGMCTRRDAAGGSAATPGSSRGNAGDGIAGTPGSSRGNAGAG
ncbi:MAG: aspartate-semialdehyde dehydrogenase [Candidatus Eisenbacteria sp.]|nr:aspartate-semialdehyde dehydrogenase [Candidatus Eisenbacteria bacterium]